MLIAFVARVPQAEALDHTHHSHTSHSCAALTQAQQPGHTHESGHHHQQLLRGVNGDSPARARLTMYQRARSLYARQVARSWWRVESAHSAAMLTAGARTTSGALSCGAVVCGAVRAQLHSGAAVRPIPYDAITARSYARSAAWRRISYSTTSTTLPAIHHALLLTADPLCCIARQAPAQRRFALLARGASLRQLQSMT